MLCSALLLLKGTASKRKRPRSLHVDPHISETYEPDDPQHDLDARFIYEEAPDEIEEEEIPYHMKDLNTLAREEIKKNEDNVLGVDGETKPDFVEDVHDQVYLMYITYEDRNYLDLLNFDTQLKTSAIEADESLDYNCPKMLYRSMGLQGYFNPILKDGTIEECPNLELTCCTNHDFEELENIWEDSLRPSTEAGHFYMEYYVKSTLVHGESYKAAAERVIEATSDEMCLKVAHSIQDFDITDALRDKTIELLAHVKEYDTRVKKSYPCLVCNHENIQYFDFKNRLLGLRGEVCLDIVHNLLEYYEHFNSFFFKYFNSLYYLARCIDKHVDIDQEEEQRLEEELQHTEEEIHEHEPHMKVTDHAHPDLTKTPEKFPVKEAEEEVDRLVEEDEELDMLKTKMEFEKIKRDQEREQGILYLDIGMLDDVEKCREEANSLLGSNALESCLAFCHRYSVWYFDKKMFRDITLMNEMFDLIVSKIIGKNLEYAVNPPGPELAEIKSVQFKYEQFNFMSNYSYIYGNEGVELSKFIGDY